jgi:hypothetical protein
MKYPAVLSLLASASIASAASVTFSSVTATFDQGSPYDVAASINGNSQDGFGWGVFGGQTVNQTAVYTASAPFSGNRLSVSIPQFLGGDHYSNDFRVSYTTDAVPSAGGNWTELAASIARAARGLTLNSLGSNRYGPSGVADGGATNYVLMAQGSFNNITGVRLELFNSAGNLGAAANGNLVISEMLVTTDNSINIALAAPTTASAAQWPGQPASFIVDGHTGSVSHPDQDAFAGFSFTTDLQGSYVLSGLELVNRAGCCPDRLSNYRVQILDDAAIPVWSGDIRTDGSNSGDGGIDTITAASGLGTFTGRFIRVTNLSSNQYQPQIAELRAFGTPVPEPSTLVSGLLAAAGLGLRRGRN